MRVSQVLCGAGPVDAVTNQALACRRLFAAWGWDGADYSAVIVPEMPRGLLRPLPELRAHPGEVLVVHYSGYTPELEDLFGAGQRTLLISHNVTPAKWFWELEPYEGVRCSLAPGQLAALSTRADAVAGVSEFNATEIRSATDRSDVGVIPILFDRSALPEAGSAAHKPASPPTILFVGRLAPHKRQDLLIDAVGALRRRHRPDVRLQLIGVPISPAYSRTLSELAELRAPGAVSFESGIPAAELWQRYLSADLFLCLSEHEGFCIPLLEAFHFGTPVIARDAGAVGEVLGEAGLLLDERDGLGTVVELLALALADAELREELSRRGRQRLAEHYSLEGAAHALRAAVEGLAG